MQFVVWIETVIAGKSVAVQRVAAVERNGVNAPAELGLTLEDGKTIPNGIEQDIIQTEVDIQSEFVAHASIARSPSRVKDMRKRRLDTVFGRVTVRCRRFIRCTCEGGKARNLWAAGPLGRLGSSAPPRSAPTCSPNGVASCRIGKPPGSWRNSCRRQTRNSPIRAFVAKRSALQRCWISG